MMMIENEYEIGDVVYLKTDREQQQRMVTSFRIFKAGEITYTLVCGTAITEHYAFEISQTKSNEFV